MTSYNFYLIRYAYRFFTCQKTEPKTDSKHRCTRLTAYWCTRLIIYIKDSFVNSPHAVTFQDKLFLTPILTSIWAFIIHIGMEALFKISVKCIAMFSSFICMKCCFQTFQVASMRVLSIATGLTGYPLRTPVRPASVKAVSPSAPT